MRYLLFFCLAAGICFTACQKDDDQSPVDCGGASYDHLTGKFLVDVVDREHYTGRGSRREFDQVVELTVDNDTLKVFNRYFPIESDTQTAFLLGTPFSGENTAVLKFSADFESFEMDTDSPGSNFGPSWSASYSGSRTDARLSTAPNAYREDLEGEYILHANDYEHFAGLDSHFVDTVFVTQDDYRKVMVGDTGFEFRVFHSYSNYWSQYDQTASEKNVHWHADSLFLEVRYEEYQSGDYSFTRWQGRKR